MALVWLDSFDSCAQGHFHDRYDTWAGVDVNRFDTTPGRTLQGCYFNSTGGTWTYLVKVLPIHDTFTVGFAVKLTTLTGGETTLLRVFRSGDALMDLTVQQNTGIPLVRNSGGALYGTASTPMATGAYNYLEFRTTAHATSGSWELRVNGHTEASGAGFATTGNGWTAYDRIYLGTFGSPVRIDDLYVTNASGSTSTGFLGPVKIACLFPAADGSLSQWSAIDGDQHHYSVDDYGTDSDATYLLAATSGATDLFQYDDLPSVALSGTTFAVTGVLIGMFARRDDCYERWVTPLMRLSSVDYEASSERVPQSYAFSHYIWDRNPATNTPFTSGQINGAQWGVKMAQ